MAGHFEAGRDARRLPRYLTAAYVLLVIIVCVLPFEGWRSIGTGPFEFLVAPWPRYYTWSDTVLNLLGYFPLGFVWAASLRRHQNSRRRKVWVVLCVTLGSCLLSLSMEAIQNYLPTRVASNIDLSTNTLGAMVGTLAGLRWGFIFERHGMIGHWRYRRFIHGYIGELGLILVGLWWLAQFEPISILFNTGDLRPLLDLPELIAFGPRRYMVLEAGIVAVQMLAIGLVLRRCMREPAPWLLGFVLVVGLCFKTVAGSAFTRSADPWQWASPGALVGLLVGALMLGVCWRLTGRFQHALACIAIVLGALLTNLAPANPFDLVSASIKPGNFLNFNSLTRLTASIWPLLALGYMAAYSTILAHRLMFGMSNRQKDEKAATKRF